MNSPKEFDIKGQKIILSGSDLNFYYLEIEGNTFQILLTPIFIRFLISNISYEYVLFSPEQFSYLKKGLKIEQPKIFYEEDDKMKEETYSFQNYIKIYNIYKSTKKIYIKSKMELVIKTKEDFESLKSKEMIGYLGKSFNSKEDFDRNFYFYFPKENQTKEKFNIENFKESEKLCKKFQEQDCTAIIKYFGEESIGKTITLIGSLKYSLNHDFFKSLYINCEAIFHYAEENPNICKQILIDEIAYFFYGNYEKYCEAAEVIKNFEIQSKDKEKNIWSLISKLLSYVGKNR